MPSANSAINFLRWRPSTQPIDNVKNPDHQKTKNDFINTEQCLLTNENASKSCSSKALFISSQKHKNVKLPTQPCVFMSNNTIKLLLMKKSKVNQVENFEKLLVFCNTHGAVYKPSKESLQPTALHALLTQAQQTLKAVNGARITYENSLSAREQKLADLPRVASRVVEALKASGASAEVLYDAAQLRNRITGTRKRKLLKPASESVPPAGEEKSYSSSHQDIASRIENFDRLTLRVARETAYQPVEEALQVSTLQTQVRHLRALQRNVMNAYMHLKNVMRTLNSLLYDKNGLFEQSVWVKAYISSLFGKGSAELKEIQQLVFVRK